jgi:hypothetical protein
LDGDVSSLANRFFFLLFFSYGTGVSPFTDKFRFSQVQTDPYSPLAVRPRAHRARERVDDKLLLVCDAAGSKRTLDAEKHCELGG